MNVRSMNVITKMINKTFIYIIKLNELDSHDRSDLMVEAINIFLHFCPMVTVLLEYFSLQYLVLYSSSCYSNFLLTKLVLPFNSLSL